MGLIRKTLFLTTPGLVRPSSKKQRAAKQTNKLLAEQNKLLKSGSQQGAPQGVVSIPRLGLHEGWFNKVATALVDLGFTERTRNTASQWGLGPDEGELQMEEEGGSAGHALCIILFANNELAQQAVASAAAMRLGLLTRAERLVYIVLGPKRWASRLNLDRVADVVGEIGVPPPRTDDTTPVNDDEKVGLGPVGEIEQLAQLHEQGTLTDEEFSAAKAKILGMEGKAES